MRIIISILFLIAVMLPISCGKQAHADDKRVAYTISSDLETVLEDGGDKVFASNTDGIFFKNGDFASSDYALSGNQSAKLSENQVYGLNINIDNIQEGQFIRASIWQKEGGTDGTLIATIKGADYSHSFRTYYDVESRSEKGWVQHYLTFVVTKGAENVSFYIFSGKKVAYFDDIKVEVLAEAPKNKLSKRLEVVFPEASKMKLDGYINDALKSEIIASKNKKYVKARIVLDHDSSDIKIKLKGDWTDHLKSGKTSYRIKMRDNKAFDGLLSFSIQHPKTRNYIHEWVIHEIADGIDLLSTEYDFINVTLDGIDFGVYALEEHFDKQLVESRNRREGPILKFDESGAWAFNYEKAKYQNWCRLPYFDASIVDVFKGNRTMGDQRLKKNFAEGRSLLERFKHGSIEAEEAFDIELLAKYYVMNELSSHNHALAWHNRRFYFNPITQKLEPILFDVIPHAKENDFFNNIEKRLTGDPAEVENVFDYKILRSKSFKDYYLHYLNVMTLPAYTDSVFNTLNEDLLKYENAISGEDESYRFDKSEYYENAKFLRSRMAILDSIWTEVLEAPEADQDWIRSQVYAPAVDSFFVKEISVNAFMNKMDSNLFELELLNYHVNDVEVIGYELEAYKDSIFYFDNSISLAAYKVLADSKKIIVNREPKKVLFKASNVPNKVISKSVINWPKPYGKTTRELLKAGFTAHSPYYEIRENTLTFKGKINISQMIYIPKDYEVVILPGASIEFSNGGGLIVNNDFTAAGTAKMPITFSCKDGSSNGLTVIKATNGVEITHTTFDGLSNLDYGNWELTGAVNIYESNAILNHVTITNNTSEDALNIIRSTFKIDELTIDHTTSDGFDADFCDGLISNSQFLNTGNDCIDFSGSIVHIANIHITKSGDKGISGGERSTLTVANMQIDGAITGIASKDQSSISGTGVQVNDAEYGFAAFQKKGEYAPASIDVKESSWNNVQVLKLIDKGSVIKLNDSEEKGTEKIDVDKLYERFGEK